MKAWRVILEIAKYTIPAMVVFATAYYLLAQMLQSQWNTRNLELQHDSAKQNTQLKLQAYERLLLLCERLSPPLLLSRVQGQDLNPSQYASLLLEAMKHEVEHNFSQQIYVSDKLWDIISLTQDQIADLVLQVAEQNKDKDAEGFREQLLKISQQMPTPPWQVAIAAIKKEAKLII